MDYTNIARIFLTHGYPVIFFLVLIEGPIVTIISSFFASMGYLNVFILYPLILFSDMVGDILWYYVGYFGRNLTGSWWTRFLGLPGPGGFEGFKRLIDKFEENQGMVLFTAKLTHAVGFPFLIASGVFRLDIKRFILFNLLAAVPKTLIFMVLGYYFGRASYIIGRYLNYSAVIGIILLALAIAAYLLVQRYSRRLFKKYEE